MMRRQGRKSHLLSLRGVGLMVFLLWTVRDMFNGIYLTEMSNGKTRTCCFSFILKIKVMKYYSDIWGLYEKQLISIPNLTN